MLSGYSSQRGIIFGDPSLEGDNSVYCWRDFACGNPTIPEIQMLVGPYDEVIARFRADQKADEQEPEHDPHGRLMLKLTALALALIVAAAVLFDGAPVFGTVVFAVVAWFPAYALLATRFHTYQTDEMFEQFRRHHGAEHAAFRASRKNKDSWVSDDLSKVSHYENECGTVYAAALLVWALIAGVAIANFPALGFLKTFGVLFGALVLLLLNTWFNPANPLKLAQYWAVARPAAAELELASRCLQEYYCLEKARDESGEASPEAPASEACEES